MKKASKATSTTQAKHPADPFAELFSPHNLGLTEDQAARFKTATTHPATCTCNACIEWWRLVGPVPDE